MPVIIAKAHIAVHGQDGADLDSRVQAKDRGRRGRKAPVAQRVNTENIRGTGQDQVPVDPRNDKRNAQCQRPEVPVRHYH